jgi:hypothetical protein
MKKLTFFVAAFLAVVTASAQFTLEQVWDRTVSADDNYSWCIGGNQRDMVYSKGKLYVQSRGTQTIYVIDAATGNELTPIAGKAGAGVAATSDGTLLSSLSFASTSKLGVAYLNGSTWTDIMDGVDAIVSNPGRIDFFEYAGTLEQGLIIAAPVNTTDLISIWPVANGALAQGVTATAPYSIASGRGTVNATGADAFAVSSNVFWLFGGSHKPIRYTFSIENDVPALAKEEFGTAGPEIVNTGGIAQFSYQGKTFAVCAASAYGSVAIYDITDGLASAAIVGTATSALGDVSENTVRHIPICVTVDKDVVYIYVYATNNGIRAYKFSQSGGGAVDPEHIGLPYTQNFANVNVGSASSSGAGTQITKVTTDPEKTDYFQTSGSNQFHLSGLDSTKNPNSTSVYVYAAGGKVRMAGASTGGTLTFKKVNSGGAAQIKVGFDAAAWPATSTTSKVGFVSVDYGTQADTVYPPVPVKSTGWTLTDEDFTHFDVTFDAIAEPTPIIIRTFKTMSSLYELRAFLDNVTISAVVPTPVADPVIVPAAGKYATSPVSVSITAVEGASIYYTVDGSTPSSTNGNGLLYTGAFDVTLPTTVKAIASKAGSPDSKITTALYEQQPTVATPTFTPGAGAYATPPSLVAITTATEDAAIYYTIDGSTPTIESTLYASPITISQLPTTVKAIAVKADYLNSVVAEAIYTQQLTVATPTFSPEAGAYATPPQVTISTTTEGASIYYTVDGSTPTVEGGTLYASPFAISQLPTTVKAIAVKADYINSAVAEAVYTQKLTVETPTFTPAAGAFVTPPQVTISTTTEGASVYYTIDGTTPTTESTLYASPFAISQLPTTVKAIAVKADYINSAVAEAVYTQQLAEVPVITGNPAGASYAKDAVATPLSVTVTPVSDGGTLSYEWFSSATDNNSGGTSVGTEATYTPSTATVGTTYYYVVVTNTLVVGVTATATSATAAVVVNQSTDVNTTLLSDVSLYPNPFTDELRLVGAGGSALTVFTSTGIAVYTQRLSATAETVDLSSLSTGLYVIILEKDGITKTLKAVKID